MRWSAVLVLQRKVCRAGYGLRKSLNVLATAVATVLGPAAPAVAQDVAIYVVDIHQGSPLAATVESLSWGGYELSDGTWQSFAPWYSAHVSEVVIDMLTQLDADTGILWGVGSGERGEKFRIDPSLSLGVVKQFHPKPNQTLSIRAGTALGGHLQEFPCQADYGDIGGVQAVNCRLAASILSPSETLKYLLNQYPSRFSLTLSFTVSF